MTFAHPKLLWLLLLVPALLALIWWSWRIKGRAMAQFVAMRLLPTLTVGLSRTRQKVRVSLFVGAFALALFSIARPQWGFDLEEARQRGLDVVIAIDTSKSMLADDVQPNRLARARLAALDLMRIAKTDRLGLVAFAGSAFLQCPLSLDDEAFRQSLDALDVNIIPQGGTAIAEAIQTALSAFKENTENHRILVIFTDGEDHDPEGSALTAAQEAAKKGLRIFTIGVGTPAGELLSSTDPYGNRVFIKDSAGNVVKSRLNEALLQQISKETDGFYLPLAAGSMDMLYERGLAPLPKAEFSAKTLRRYHERYQWFLGAAIVLLLAEMLFPERSRRAKTAAAKPAAVAAMLLMLGCGHTFGSVNDALDSYKRGKYSKARTEYEKLAKKKPDDPRLRFNAGAAAFQDEDYDDALRHFSSSLSAPDVKLQQQSYYNLGNTQVRLGDHAKDAKEKQQSWEQAIHSYDNALKLNAADEDAKFNKQIVQQKLEELKKQQQQQQQNKDDKQDKKDDEQKQDDKNQEQKNQDQKKQDQQKEDQQKSEQQKKEEQEQQQQQQQKKQDESKADDKQKDQQSAQDQRGEKPDPAQQAAQYNKVMQMTPQQAAQLLEAQKAEEKTMIFLPQNVQTNKPGKPQNRVFKDW